jgi:hypothetical protein
MRLPNRLDKLEPLQRIDWPTLPLIYDKYKTQLNETITNVCIATITKVQRLTGGFLKMYRRKKLWGVDVSDGQKLRSF